MHAVKTFLLVSAYAAGACALLAAALMLLPSLIEVRLMLRGELLFFGVKLRPFSLPLSLGFSESAAYHPETGLVFCGREKSFGRKVRLPKAKNKHGGRILKALMRSLKGSFRITGLTAVGSLAGREDPDKAVMAAGAMRGAAAMLIAAFPFAEACFAISPDPASCVSKADVKCIIKILPGKLLVKTISAYFKCKGEEK